MKLTQIYHDRLVSGVPATQTLAALTALAVDQLSTELSLTSACDTRTSTCWSGGSIRPASSINGPSNVISSRRLPTMARLLITICMHLSHSGRTFGSQYYDDTAMSVLHSSQDFLNFRVAIEGTNPSSRGVSSPGPHGTIHTIIGGVSFRLMLQFLLGDDILM